MAIQRVGHIVIKMRDLEAAKGFYRDILGMKIATESERGVFFRFDEYHHDIAVFKVSENAELPKADQVGLAHMALVIDSFDSLVRMYRRLKEHGVDVDHTTDHAFTKSIYCRDPEGNMVEIYCEVPEDDYHADGMGRMTPLDLDTPAAALA
ncbi:MAG TPA: VOC family protein [Dehalococcoidia bacterium]|nr:VOC family protein [Dehalococcoidia bacterium]